MGNPTSRRELVARYALRSASVAEYHPCDFVPTETKVVTDPAQNCGQSPDP